MIFKVYFQHEDASVAMFDYILQDNTKVNESFDRKGLKDIDKQFIKELIGESNEVALITQNCSNPYNPYQSIAEFLDNI